MPSLLLRAALLLSGGCDRGFVDPSRALGPERPSGPRHAEVVHQPPWLGAAEVEERDALGRPVAVACATCHAPGELARDPGEDVAMHQGFTLVHGALTCGSCHDLDDPRRLRLADGQPLDFDEAQWLCAQCHGPVARAWSRGAHGGMSGHWDLQRGPRLRNHCVDCHAPHAPAIQPVMPAPATLDRGRRAQAER